MIDLAPCLRPLSCDANASGTDVSGYECASSAVVDFPTREPNACLSSFKILTTFGYFFALSIPDLILGFRIGVHKLTRSSPGFFVRFSINSLYSFSPVSVEPRRPSMISLSITVPVLRCLAGPSSNGSRNLYELLHEVS